MGSGKTTLGKILAEKIGFEFIDIDEIIEKKTGKPIKDIFSNEGAVFFRDLEREALKETLNHTNAVVSLGGGTLLEEENLLDVKESGSLIHLSAKPSEIWSRIKDSEKKYLLQGRYLNESELEDIYLRISNLMQIRERGYNQADFSVETDNRIPEDLIADILKFLDLRDKK